MSREKKNKSGSSWGLILSLLLHGTIIVLVLLWGIKQYNGSKLNQPINVSLSSLDYRGSSEKSGGGNSEVKEPEKEQQPEVKEEKKEEKKEEVVKKEEEPEKEEVKKEEKKVEPDKKAVPLEKKKVVKKEKKEEEKKKEVKKTEKKKIEKKEPKKAEKKEEPKKETKVARSDVLQDLKRKNVIDSLKEGGNNNDSGGLKGSDSNDVAGNSSGVNAAILNVYNDAIWRKIKPKFRIPPNIPRDGSLIANVYFKIDNNGNVSGVRINKSSGNAAFDNFCINTIISSSPLPPPPSDIAKLVITEGFEIPMSNEG